MGNTISQSVSTQANVKLVEHPPIHPLPQKLYSNLEVLNCQHGAEYAPLSESATRIRDAIPSAERVPKPVMESCSVFISFTGNIDAQLSICTPPSSNNTLEMPGPPTTGELQSAVRGLINGCPPGPNDTPKRLGGTNTLPTASNEFKLFVLLDKPSSNYS